LPQIHARPFRLLAPLAVLVAWLALVPGRAAAATETETRIGGIDVVVWSGANPGHTRQPVLVFSHALYLCPTQSRFLTEALADAGYLVVAPRHADSSCAMSVWPSPWRMSGKPYILWSDLDFRDRADDVRAVVAGLRRDARYRDVVDLSKLALMGHSLGGYTVLGLAGAWPSWRMPGVRAVIALTPYSLPFRSSEGLRNVSVPTMYQVGTLDPVFTLPLEEFAYEQTPGPKALVKVENASHLAWTDLGATDRATIVDNALAFLDRYVQDAGEPLAMRVAFPAASGAPRN